MRTLKLSLVAAIATTTIAACTVKDVDAPQMAGPSSLAKTIVMVADRDQLLQDGSQEAAIRLTAQVQPGQSENVRLRAQVFVDGVAQDFGTLSNKSPITPTTIFYRAPAAPTTVGGQVPTRVTIAVTPDDSGDFRGEATRTIDLLLVPPGVILPTNPNLAANFTISPNPPRVMDIVTFNAGTTTNNGVNCNLACTFAWDFGDGTTGSGQIVTHQFRAVGSFQVRLTVTDSRGATALSVQTVNVGPGAPLTAVTFTTSPASPGVNQEIFFNASASQAAPGRTLTSFAWNFGDGNTGSGAITTHRYEAGGNYQVQLTVTDDAGTIGRSSVQLQIGPALGPEPVAALTCVGGNAFRSEPVSCDASLSRPGTSANIVSYTFNWGDGSAEEVQTNPIQTHQYLHAGTFRITMTVRDSLGRTDSAQATVTLSQ